MDSHGELSYNELLTELRKTREECERLEQLRDDMVLEINELNTRLLRAEQVKSGFLSNIRNEIINPLTAIIGLSEKITGDKVDPELFRKIGKLLNREGFSLDYQIRNLIAAAEIEAGVILPVATSVAVENLVHDQIKCLEFFKHDKEVVVEVKAYCSSDVFKTDPHLLRLIVLNLIANAIKFSQPYQQVNVDISCENKHLKIAVQDTGAGISLKDQKVIFERFRQGNQGSSKTHHGHGLGLPIVKELTDILRGTLLISSGDNGTLITITLPELSPDLLEEGFLSSSDEILFGDEETF